ncbi:WD40 repeat-like protein [Multifurca ochricompacta]|uniref:WD40 repeat-like protein n=1 Tax=Multifurca ochricompacta TaxID=376703 RepID=A0AAD4QRP2_9AGAM|nr:WD40 repeat-like protein [Multifurca ochricompacta]
MPGSDSDEDIDDAEFDNDVEEDIDQEIFDAIEAGAEDATDGDPFPKDPTPPSQRSHSLSPSHIRRSQLRPSVLYPRSYTVEAICALPHPVPTHSLAATPCMTHFLTGSEDGYIRDYDIFSAVNGKIFLTAPQRHHAGVVEGTLKSGQVRSWWENPETPMPGANVERSPVHSLALHGDALWGLSGTNAGQINLFTVRHEPGRLFHVMQGHRGPVSALALQHDERGFFSAGWDGQALQWDLDTGQIARRFVAHSAQLAALAVRPLNSDYPNIPPQFSQIKSTLNLSASTDHGQLGQPSQPATVDDASNSANAPTGRRTFSHDRAETRSQLPMDADAHSEADSLFGDEPDAEGEPDHSLDTASTAPVLLSTPSVGPEPSPLPASLAVPSPKPPPIPAPAPKNAPPILDAPSYAGFSSNIIMTAAMDGQVVLWDCRAPSGAGYGVGRLWMSEKTPPWCLSACWSPNGGQIYAGRRNGTVDVWDVRQLGRSGPVEVPRLLKTLRNPPSSGIVSCVVAFPDGRHIACACSDNIRLWNAAEAGEGEARGRMQFKIIPGHHGGMVSQMLADPGARFLMSASGNRGWHGEATRTVFVHDIKPIV